MKILEQYIKQLPKEKIVKELGYSSSQKGIVTLEFCLSCKTLYDWQQSGFYDFKYTPTDFFKALCKLLHVDQYLIDKEIENAKDMSREMKKHEDSYIFVNTNFKKKNEPIFALAFMESKRKFKLDKKEFIFKSADEMLAIVKEKIKTHYKSSNGELPMWGKIVSYVYHQNENVYIFDTDANEIENSVNEENVAFLSLK